MRLLRRARDREARRVRREARPETPRRRSARSTIPGINARLLPTAPCGMNGFRRSVAQLVEHRSPKPCVAVTAAPIPSLIGPVYKGLTPSWRGQAPTRLRGVPSVWVAITVAKQKKAARVSPRGPNVAPISRGLLEMLVRQTARRSAIENIAMRHAPLTSAGSYRRLNVRYTTVASTDVV
jgi:hypothetical protein